MTDFIIKEFYKRMTNVNLNVYGILSADMNIHSLGTDSKIIGRIFEMLTQPVLEGIAKDYGFISKFPMFLFRILTRIMQKIYCMFSIILRSQM